jgi:peptidoglycan hydrolase CwlO-like protein
MKTKHLITIIIIMACLNVFGQQKQTTPITERSQKTEVQVLEETVLKLQAENQAMQKRLDRMEKEIEICREDVRHKESIINENQGHWLTILSIVIGAIVTILGVGLGVVAPIILNLRNDRKHRKNIEKVRAELKTQINSAQQDAKSAKESLSEITCIKEDIESIKKDIDKSKKAAERFAKKAMASKLFTQALSEKDKTLSKMLFSYSQG